VKRLVIVSDVPEIEQVGVGRVLANGSPQFSRVQLAAPLVNLPV
jgi:hypothetical protein